MGKEFGQCHICGKIGDLSFEHVPPSKAFNNRPLLRLDLLRMIGRTGASALAGDRIERKGAGAYTLCVMCNTKTGGWYGGPFVRWVEQGMLILRRAGGRPTLYYRFDIFPLRTIKQILCMFFSVNSPRFSEAHPDLAEFVLNKDKRHLPEKARICAFYTTSSFLRSAGVTGLLHLGWGVAVFSEITFPPYGYILSFDSKPHDPRLCDISFFADFTYADRRRLSLRLPVLEVNTYFPGDYRTNAEIQRDFKQNIDYRQNTPTPEGLLDS